VIVLWDLERAEKVATFQLGSAPVTSLAFTNGSNMFAAAAQDGSVALFDISTPSTPTVLLDGREGSGQLVAAARLRGLVVSGGADRTIRLWQTEMQSLARTYRTQGGEVTALDITADGRYLAGADADGSVRVWSNSSTRAVRTIKAHDGRITAVAFGPDRMLATAGEDGKVKVWNLRAGRVVRTFGGNTGPVRALSFSTEGRRLVGAGQDGVIRLWSLAPAPTVSGI
jgi:WD40 repeat protein